MNEKQVEIENIIHWLKGYVSVIEGHERLKEVDEQINWWETIKA